MSMQTEQMWDTLCQAGVVEGSAPETGELESPWYVKVLLAFSGWLAAVFLLGFIGVGFEFVFNNNNTAVAFIIGGIMIAGAFAILRIRKNEFFEHLALAVSLAGQALVVFAIFKISNHNEKIAWMLMAILQVSLAVIMPNFVHRVFSSFFAAFAFSMTLTIMSWHYVGSGTVMLLAAMCWLNEFHYPQHIRKIRAIGYGLVLALIQLKGSALFGYRTMGWRLLSKQSDLWANTWFGEVLIGAVTLWVAWHLLKRYKQTISSRLSITALLGALLLCAVSMKVQGITVGIVIILLGFSGTNRVL
ncbi:MAG: DUF4401 domain-containing protein, partial [Oceanicoccus sp.]|uniref:DUF4401 domain-containing protein n=1 Tax=Oceanicoccus sp. TaxID=2691044 RepID=UPI00262BD882